MELPYLSVVRIETALHIILHRYIQGSNQHIADLICRIPASLAPSTYYSSHSNNFLVNRYRQAIELLNYDNQLIGIVLKFLEEKGTTGLIDGF